MRKDYRHEIKHKISPMDMLCIRSRLSAVARRDSHAVDGKYHIRSLYFDTPDDKALREKIDGVDRREKFRIRYYDDDLSFIRLEKKSKLNGLGTKDMAVLSRENAQAIVDGRIDWMLDDHQPLIHELYVNMKSRNMKPKTIVDYIREPFIFDPGNVRVTLAQRFRHQLGVVFVLGQAHAVSVAADIRDMVQLDLRDGSYSKYAECRMYD